MPIDFKGKTYTTVAERVDQLHTDTDGNYTLTTEIIKMDDNAVLMKATLTIGENVYTGHAFERADDSFINKTSHVENCETSSIGRALASANWHGGEFCSADELANAVTNQNKPKLKPKTAPNPKPVEPPQTNNTPPKPTETIESDDSVRVQLVFGKHKGRYIDTLDGLEAGYLMYLIDENSKLFDFMSKREWPDNYYNDIVAAAKKQKARLEKPKQEIKESPVGAGFAQKDQKVETVYTEEEEKQVELEEKYSKPEDDDDIPF